MRANRSSAAACKTLVLGLALAICPGCQFRKAGEGMKPFSSPFAKHELKDDDDFKKKVNRDPFPTASRVGIQSSAKEKKE